MAAKTTIVMKNDAGENIVSIGRDFGPDDVRGLTSDERHEADMRILAEDGYGWTEEVENPDFDPEQEVSESNPETIPNPITIWEAAAYALGRYGEQVVVGGIRKRQLALAKAQIEAAVEASNNSTSVTVE